MTASRVLIIPGLNGYPGPLMGSAPKMFPGLRAVPFDHRERPAIGGVEQLADQALAELDADDAADEPAYVCGESFGGTVALTLARRYPDRVRGLVLLSSFGRYPSRRALGGDAGLALWDLLGDDVSGCIVRATRPFGVFNALGFRFSRQALWTYLGHPDGSPSAYRTKCEASIHFDATPWLSSLTCPTFVLTGSWDPIVPISASAELARLIPNARLHRLPGGHVIHLVRADEVGERVTQWMTREAS